MLQIYEINCECGAAMIVQVGTDDVLLRVYCKTCKKFVLKKGSKTSDIGDSSQELPKTPPQENPHAASAKAGEGDPNAKAGDDSAPKQQTLRESSKKFAHFEIEKMLGEGAMGKIYLATDEKSREKIALKILRKPNDTKALEYFIREIQVLRQLNHPNIVKIKTWGNSRGYPYFAMEYVLGSSMDAMLEKGPIPPPHAVHIICHILEALVYAAQFQIIHRDIKPSNILVAASGAVKLIDLGVGKMLQGSNLTQTGQMIGTGYYMPIEQLQDAKRADYRADVYAVGATLYHGLAGQPPYSECGKNLNKMILAKMENRYTSLEERCPQLPSELLKIVQKAMAYKPEDRYPSAQEMRDALVDFYRNHFKQK